LHDLQPATAAAAAGDPHDLKPTDPHMAITVITVNFVVHSTVQSCIIWPQRKIFRIPDAEMAGYQVDTVDEAKAGLICSECGFILREAVQTFDGLRLCMGCFEAIKE